jgi:hypothetical protein
MVPTIASVTIIAAAILDNPLYTMNIYTTNMIANDCK